MSQDAVDPQVLRAVTQRVIDNFTEMGVLFTALDVSNQVKRTLPSVRHREVSPTVRDLFGQGAFGDEYIQTLIDVQAGHKTVQAFLYHLDDDDADMYGDSMRSQNATPPVSAAALDDMDVPDDLQSWTVKAGRDGRGRIPRKLIENAGITTYDVILRYIDAETRLEIRAWQPGDATDGEVLAYVHPSLLHLPAKSLLLFDTSEPIDANVIGDRVDVTGVRAP